MCKLYTYIHVCVCPDICTGVPGYIDISEDLVRRRDEVTKAMSPQDTGELGSMGPSLAASDGRKSPLHSLIGLSVSPKSLLLVIRNDSS